MTEAPITTGKAPARKRAGGTAKPATKATVAKPTAGAVVNKPTAKAAVKPVVAATEVAAVAAGEQTKIAFALVALDPTKTYAKFTPPADSGCVGTLYVPHGVTEVRVLLIGPKSE